MNKVLKEKYYQQGGLLNAMANDQASWLWKSWFEAKNIIQKGVRFQVGDGKSINIWESPWLHSSLDFKPTIRKLAYCNLTWVFELMQGGGIS